MVRSFVRHLGEAFGKPDFAGDSDRHQLQHHALSDVRRGQKHQCGIPVLQRQHDGSVIHVCDQRRLRHQTHFGLASGAGSQIEDSRILGLHTGADGLEKVRILAQCVAARFPQLLQADGIAILARQQDKARGQFLFSSGFDQRLHALGVLDEDESGLAGVQIDDEIAHGIAGVERCRNGARGHDSQVGQIEFGAGLGIQRDDFAFEDADSSQATSDLLGGLPVLLPGVGLILAFTDRLLQRGSVRISGGGLFEDRVDGSGFHVGFDSL